MKEILEICTHRDCDEPAEWNISWDIPDGKPPDSLVTCDAHAGRVEEIIKKVYKEYDIGEPPVIHKVPIHSPN